MAEKMKIPSLLNSLDKRNKVNALQPFWNGPHLRIIWVNFALHHPGGKFQNRDFPILAHLRRLVLLSVSHLQNSYAILISHPKVSSARVNILFFKSLTMHIGELIKSKSQPFLNAIDVSICNSVACVLRTAKAVTSLVLLHWDDGWRQRGPLSRFLPGCLTHCAWHRPYNLRTRFADAEYVHPLDFLWR